MENERRPEVSGQETELELSIGAKLHDNRTSRIFSTSRSGEAGSQINLGTFSLQQQRL